MSALVAIIIGVIVLIVGLMLALKVFALLLGIGVAVVVYFVAEKLIGRGR